jgi:hypothetical protein
MSRHFSPARTARNKAACVIAGYDRRLGEFFLQVFCGTKPLIHKMNFSHQGFRTAQHLCDALFAQGISVVESLVQELRNDGANNVGNRIVEHSFDAPLKVIASGE